MVDADGNEMPWLPRPKQRWSVSVEFSTGVISLAMPAEFLDEALRENRQGPFRLPCNSQPPADSCATLYEWDAANMTGRNDDRGRDHRDTKASTCQ